MSSPRSPSPAASQDASAPSTPLTPKSKLKQLFASLGDESDEEESNKGAKLTASPTPPAGRSSQPPKPSIENAEDNEEEDDEDDILRPRGRLAARMRADSPKSVDTEDDVRKRVTQPVQIDSAQPNDAPPQRTGGVLDNQEVDDEDDDIQIRHPRRRAPRPAVSKEGTPLRETSPDMFVTPSKEMTEAGAEDGAGSDDDEEFTQNLMQSKRFKSRLLDLQQKRIAREAEEKRKQSASNQDDLPEDTTDVLNDGLEDFVEDGDSDGVTDDEGGRRLTQENRAPARQASKKALEEMHRESQRLSRSLQLAHEAKTKKRITKASLFERFNFKPAGKSPQKPSASSPPTTPSSAHNTDSETRDHHTPPSSPPPVGKEVQLATNEAVSAPSLAVTTSDANAKQDASVTGNDEDLPDLDTLISQTPVRVTVKKLDKGKGKATAADFEEAQDEKPVAKRQFRVKLPTSHVTIDPDDELVIADTTKNSKLDAIFKRVPAQREKVAQSLQALRILAQIGGSPGKERPTRRNNASKPSMTVGELQTTLHQRAREQARLERERRLDALRAKGVHIQTEEEREREMQHVEDIVARARREAEEIMRQEREEAKKDKKNSGAAADPLAWDDSDEEGSEDEYREPEEAPVEIDLSGSEDEDAEMGESDGEGEGEDEEEGQDLAGDGLVDDQAESTDGSADEDNDAQDSAEEDAEITKVKPRRTKKHVTIISDDEDDDVEDNDQENVDPSSKPSFVQATPKPKAAFFKSPSTGGFGSPQVPTSVLRSATKTFIPGLPINPGAPAGLGLTQIFAGTMDDSQVGASGAPGSPSQPMPTFPGFPGDLGFSQDDDDMVGPDAANDVIRSSQPPGEEEAEPQERETQNGMVDLHFTQSQMHGFDSLIRDEFATQQSEWLEATQDEGFQNRSPLKQRFVDDAPQPHSTIGTVVPPASAAGQEDDHDESSHPHNSSPLLRKKGKLRRKIAVIDEEEEGSDKEESEQPGDPMEGVEESQLDGAAGSEHGEDAFNVMNRAAAREERERKQQEAFDRKKSKAKEMVEDQAAESEDEYAGLGGVDGEDSDDDGEDVKEMIDDKTAATALDKAKIAALYADRERASDEQQVEKLFRDITSGMLRRKRMAGGGDFDLSDDDDGGEARRRLKRRQFAKMQKALFADERLSRVAENPRTSAFMRTIEDRGSDEEMDFLFEHEKPQSLAAARDASVSIPNSQPEPESQQPVSADAGTSSNKRRTKDGKKPSNLGEIRESLSNLLEDPNSMGSVISATDLDSDSDADAEDNSGRRVAGKRPGSSHSSKGNKENRDPRRRGKGVAAVVDRISLKRSGSSISSASSVSNSNGGRPAAFAAGNHAVVAAGSGSGAGNGSGTGVFKVPALLRRATTNSSLVSHSAPTALGGSSSTSSSTSSSGTNTPNPLLLGGGEGGGFRDDAKIKKGAGKKSGINFFARENERLAALAEKERRREARKWKGAEGRGKVVGGLFAAGRFE